MSESIPDAAGGPTPTPEQAEQMPLPEPEGRASKLVSGVSLLWGLQFSFFGPTLTLVLVALYHATAGQVGTVLMIYNIAGFVVALVVPAWADRHRNYLTLTVLSAVIMVLLVVALALSPSLWWAAAALVVLGAPGGLGMTMMFAHLRHIGASVRDVMNTRAMMSLSWVAGPPLASFIIGWWGERAILWAVAIVGLGTVATNLAWARRTRAAVASGDQPEQAKPTDLIPMGKVGVGVVTVAWVLLQAANSAAMSTMNLFVTQRLGLSIIWGGITLAVAAGLEVPAMTLIGRLSSRVSMVTLVISGCLAACLFYVLMVFVRSPWMLIPVQVFNGWAVAVIEGLGVTVFQRIIEKPGMASGIYTNTRRVGNIVTGPMIALAGWSSMGYGIVFVAGAAITVVATVMVILTFRGVHDPAARHG